MTPQASLHKRPLMKQLPRRPRGFTLIELLVAIAVIGILIAILLPAVQQAREAARRTQCRNHLKQLGLAVHNYHDAHTAMPPSRVEDWDAWLAGSPNFTGWWSWQTRLLPYLEQPALYDAVNYEINAFGCDPAVNKVIGATLPVLTCPSDPGTPAVHEFDDGFCAFPRPFGVTNYFVCRGGDRQHDPFDCPFLPEFIACNGVFPQVNTSLRFRDVRDGTSNTIAIGERPADSERYYGWWAAGGGTDCHALGDHVLDLNEGHYKGSPDNADDVIHYWSMHSGGSHFLLCDGSVRFISYSIDHNTYLALGSRDGGEAVGGF